MPVKARLFNYIVISVDGTHTVESKSKRFFLPFDRTTADSLIIKLNLITNESDIKQGINNYRNTEKTKGEDAVKFYEQLVNLVNGISLAGRVLSGTCDQCIITHNPKDSGRKKSIKTRFKSRFSS
jgi:hypothetical protein